MKEMPMAVCNDTGEDNVVPRAAVSGTALPYEARAKVVALPQKLKACFGDV
jgi:hypothetical protein